MEFREKVAIKQLNRFALQECLNRIFLPEEGKCGFLHRNRGFDVVFGRE